MLPPNENCRARVVSVVQSMPGVPRGMSDRLVRSNFVEVALNKDHMGQWVWMAPSGGWPLIALNAIAQQMKESR